MSQREIITDAITKALTVGKVTRTTGNDEGVEIRIETTARYQPGQKGSDAADKAIQQASREAEDALENLRQKGQLKADIHIEITGTYTFKFP